MTLRPLPPIPDASEWTQGGLQPPGLEYINEQARVIGSHKSELEALAEQIAALSATVDTLLNADGSTVITPGRVWLGRTSPASGTSVGLTDIEAGAYSAIELEINALTSTGSPSLLVGIDDANGASYTNTTLGTYGGSISVHGKIWISRVSEAGENKVVFAILHDRTGGSLFSGVKNYVAETGLITAVNLGLSGNAFNGGNVDYYGIV